MEDTQSFMVSICIDLSIVIKYKRFLCEYESNPIFLFYRVIILCMHKDFIVGVIRTEDEK